MANTGGDALVRNARGSREREQMKTINKIICLGIMAVFVFGAFVGLAGQVSAGQNEVGINAAGDFTEYPVTTAAATPQGITINTITHDIWFTEKDANKIGKMTQAGVCTEYAITTPAVQPISIVFDVDTSNLWFDEVNAAKIGKMTSAGVCTEYSTPAGWSLSLDTTNNFLWFASVGNNITKLGINEPVGLNSYPITSAGANVGGTVVHPATGDLWFTEYANDKIGKMTSAGVCTEYGIMTENAGATDITVYPTTGDLWFTENSAGAIGKMTTAGVYTEYLMPYAFASPGEMTINANNGDIWVFEQQNHSFVKMTQAGVFTEYPITTTTATVNGLVFDTYNNRLWFTLWHETSNSVAFMETVSNPQIDNYVGWTSPEADDNYTNPDTFDITCNGTGQDMDTVTLNVDMWWYWQSNHTRTHFYNSSSDIVVTATTWTFDESDWTMPTVTSSKVCRLVYRVQIVLTFLLSVPSNPNICYETVWGISDPFTLNREIDPQFNDDLTFVTPLAEENYSVGDNIPVCFYGTGTDLDSLYDLSAELDIGFISNDTWIAYDFPRDNEILHNDTYYRCWSNITAPSVDEATVCRIYVDMGFIIGWSKNPTPGIMTTSRNGYSGAFTINPIIPPVVTENDITITVTSAGDAGKADIGDTITIEAIIQCDLGIESARVLYKPVGSDSWTSVVMELVAGDNESGTWEGVIPAQDAAGFVYYKVTATSTEGLDATTSEAAVQVTAAAATPTPAPYVWNFTTMQWAGIAAMAIGILALLGLLFRSALTVAAGGFVLVIIGIGLVFFFLL